MTISTGEAIQTESVARTDQPATGGAYQRGGK